MAGKSLRAGPDSEAGPARRKRGDYADWGVMTQSITGALDGATTRIRQTLPALCLGAALACPLAGCGLSSVTSGLGSSIFGGSSSSNAEPQGVSEEQLLAAAKAGDGSPAPGINPSDVSPGCPRFVVWPRDNTLTIYEPGRIGDGLAIMHRGEITKTARECYVEAGRVIVRYGFSGRILLGPRGKSGPITLPVNVFVTDAKREKVATDHLKVDSAVAVESPIGYFSAVRTVTFNVPEGSRPGEYEVFVGFDHNTPNAG